MIEKLVYSTIDVEYGSWNWLRREIALRSGYSPDHNLLGRVERVHVDSIIESGVMQFVQGAWPTIGLPPDTPAGEGRMPDAQHVEAEKDVKRHPPHRWSFMQKSHSFATVSGTSSYDLPDDFGATIQEPTTSRAGGRIAIARLAHIKQLISVDNEAAEPRYCALERTSIGGSTKQTTKLVLYPVPNAVETVTVEYSANPEILSKLSQYPPGGVEHAETVLACCYLVMAQRGGEGLEEATRLVQDRMVASIVLDRASSKPTTDGVWVEDDGRFNVAYLSRMIGRHIGAGPNPKTWTHQQEQLIAETIRRARRRVYNPPVLPGEPYAHDWTFLRPIGDLVTVSGVWEYDLPSDFAQLYGPITYSTTGSVLYSPIEFVGEMTLRRLLQRQEASTRPSVGAIRVKQHSDALGTRYELLLWPVPDDEYELQYRYRVNPDTSGPNSLPALVDNLDLHGGDRYSEMYLEAAMMEADFLQGQKRSEHEERFMRAVQSAVSQDRLTNATDSLGYNGDSRANAGEYDGDWTHHDLDENVVTYNGITY